MPCTCNAICNNDCASNQICTGHVPVCINTYSFTTIIITTIVRASHLLQLQTAIDNERINSGRRFNASEPAYCFTHTPGNVACSNNAFAAYSWTAGVAVNSVILASHFNDIKQANNQVTSNSGYGGTVAANFNVDGIIYAANIQELQTRINQTRNVCICDSHCNCDPSDCGCNGECPSDDYYYYYYP